MSEITLDIELWPKQALVFESPATEILFGGASEGGKSHLVRALLITLCTACENLSCVLIRKNFSDILSNHLLGDQGFHALLKPLTDCGKVRITKDGIKFYETNSYIEFQHCADERQFTNAQGVERDVVVVDEATQIAERLIKVFGGWCRMTPAKREKLPEFWRKKLPLILYTANPIGASLGYFRRQFVKARPEGQIEYVGGFLRQFIKSVAKDNKSVDLKAHTDRLYSRFDAATAKALDDGDWDSPLGDMFPEWDEERHVVPDFIPPEHWYRYRTFDWGSADPAATYWIAVSDGEMFDADCWAFKEGTYVKTTKRFWFPKGAKIYYREWYICREDEPAKGLGLRNADIARGIVERSPGATETGLITLTDSFVFPDRGETDGQTIAKTFKENGVPLTLGDTSRVTGWAACRDALIGVQLDLNSEYRYPMVYICEGCRYLRDYIPALPRHANEAKRHNDAAESGEATHACDAWRLGVMALAPVKTAPPTTELARQNYLKEFNAKVALATKPPTMADAIKLLTQQKSRQRGKQF
jgi:hypothetical protein